MIDCWIYYIITWHKPTCNNIECFFIYFFRTKNVHNVFYFFLQKIIYVHLTRQGARGCGCNGTLRHTLILYTYIGTFAVLDVSRGGRTVKPHFRHEIYLFNMMWILCRSYVVYIFLMCTYVFLCSFMYLVLCINCFI